MKKIATITIMILWSVSHLIASPKGTSTPSLNQLTSKASSKKQVKTIKAKTQKATCSICCTMSVNIGGGVSIGVTACAGGLFTSCASAGVQACEKAMQKSLDILNDLR